MCIYITLVIVKLWLPTKYKGSTVEISNYAGKFHVNDALHGRDELILLCAGTGLTPMLRILPTAIKLKHIL